MGNRVFKGDTSLKEVSHRFGQRCEVPVQYSSAWVQPSFGADGLISAWERLMTMRTVMVDHQRQHLPALSCLPTCNAPSPGYSHLPSVFTKGGPEVQRRGHLSEAGGVPTPVLPAAFYSPCLLLPGVYSGPNLLPPRAWDVHTVAGDERDVCARECRVPSMPPWMR